MNITDTIQKDTLVTSQIVMETLKNPTASKHTTESNQWTTIL